MVKDCFVWLYKCRWISLSRDNDKRNCVPSNDASWCIDKLLFLITAAIYFCYTESIPSTDEVPPSQLAEDEGIQAAHSPAPSDLRQDKGAYSQKRQALQSADEPDGRKSKGFFKSIKRKLSFKKKTKREPLLSEPVKEPPQQERHPGSDGRLERKQDRQPAVDLAGSKHSVQPSPKPPPKRLETFAGKYRYIVQQSHLLFPPRRY